MTQLAHGRRRPSILDPHSSAFGLFSDVLYTGVLVFVGALPVVTGFAALSAGVETLRDARAGEGRVRARVFVRVLASRLRRSPVLHVVVPVAVTALLAVNAVVLPWTGLDPTWAAAVSVTLGAVLGAAALRVAGAWRPAVPARRTLHTVSGRMAGDATGTLLLAAAVAAAGAIVWTTPLLALVMPGVLALAAVALDRDVPQP